MTTIALSLIVLGQRPDLAPREGAKAPDFVAESFASGERFRLSEITGKKPVVLIFGSCT